MTFELRGEHVELCNLLKLTGLADSSGQGKAMVAQALVRVDGELESRKAAKIRAGQMVVCNGIKIEIQAAPCNLSPGIPCGDADRLLIPSLSKQRSTAPVEICYFSCRARHRWPVDCATSR